MELKDEACIGGTMADNLKDSGRRIKCMVLGLSDGRMDGSTEAIMLLMRSKATGCLNGQMDGSMRGIGMTGFRMGRG